MSDQELMMIEEPGKRILTITADNRLIWHDPMPVSDPAIILAATDVVANHYGLVRREFLEAAETREAELLTFIFKLRAEKKAVEDKLVIAVEALGKIEGGKYPAAARKALAELEEMK